jgi:glycosyltransferase involved in cell wall biosynthesis
LNLIGARPAAVPGLMANNESMPIDGRSKPHVLTLTDSLGPGGAERVAVELAVRADPTRFQRSLCVTRSEAPNRTAQDSIGRMQAEGVNVLRMDRRTRADLRAWRPLIGYLRSSRVDILHAHKFGSNVWAAVLGRLLRVPVIVAHEHTWSFEGQPLRKLVDRTIVARGSDVVIAVSEADRRRMIELVGMPANRVVLIPNGIPTPPPDDGAAIRAELGFGEDVPILALTAVLRDQKAIDVMLKAMAHLRTTQPLAQLLIVGSGDQTRLRAEASRLGVADAVTFMGSRADVSKILAASDVGVLSSDFEGMPLAVLEYMAASLPVVATDVGGVPQIVDHGRSGLLVAPRDPAALAGAIETVLSDRALASSMGKAGHARQQREFSVELMAERVSRLYDSLLAGLGPRPVSSEPVSTSPSRESGERVGRL